MTQPNAIDLIRAERQRQIEKEGYTAEHDDGHLGDQMAVAAAFYAFPDDMRDMGRYQLGGKEVRAPRLWPWPPHYWKPTPDDRIRELVKAGALVAAEIDRLLRKQSRRKRRAARQ
jgi:hypothetical protein